MPFSIRRRGGEKLPATAPSDAEGPRLSTVEAYTDEWHISASIHLEGRLSDRLNRREAIEISDVRWAPIDGSAPPTAAPGLKVVDPYDLVLVVAGTNSLPALSDAERAAYRIHKVQYDVLLEAPPFRIVGAVGLHRGSEPERLLDRSTELFVPVVRAFLFVHGRLVGDYQDAVVLVNRAYLRSVEQVDRSDMRAQLLAGQKRA